MQPKKLMAIKNYYLAHNFCEMGIPFFAYRGPITMGKK